MHGERGDAGIWKVGFGEIGHDGGRKEFRLVGEIDAKAARETVGRAVDGLPVELCGDERDPLERLRGAEVDLHPCGIDRRGVEARVLIAELLGGLADDGRAECGEFAFQGDPARGEAMQFRIEDFREARGWFYRREQDAGEEEGSAHLGSL